MPARLRTTLRRIGKVCVAVGLLYLFLVSIRLLSSGLKMTGEDFGEILIESTTNPFVGLLIGMLVTSIIQSSSTTTSLIVAFVAGQAALYGETNPELAMQALTNAIPMVMGANIGTTVTNTLVALAHITRREEFRRALAAASVHDLFNVLTTIVLLPIEMLFHPLREAGSWCATSISFGKGFEYVNPIKAATGPVVDVLKGAAQSTGDPKVMGVILAVFAAVGLFVALVGLVKVLKSAAMGRVELLFDRVIGGNPLKAMIAGMIITAMVQSSSVTTSLLVPMAGAGIISLERIFPMTLGANVGTTVTAILAGASGNVYGMAIAFSHLLFNIAGILIYYPIPQMRAMPLRLARGLANLLVGARFYAIIYIVVAFFLIPGALIMIYRWLS